MQFTVKIVKSKTLELCIINLDTEQVICVAPKCYYSVIYVSQCDNQHNLYLSLREHGGHLVRWLKDELRLILLPTSWSRPDGALSEMDAGN